MVRNIDVSQLPSLVASLGAAQMVGYAPYQLKPNKISSSASKDEVELQKRQSGLLSIQLDGKVIGWSSVDEIGRAHV